MSTSMAVDSGHGSSSEELQPQYEAAKNEESKPVAGAPDLTSPHMVVRQVAHAIKIIKNVHKLISDAIWNKQQCNHIGVRYTAIAERLELIVGVNSSIDVDDASDGGSSIEESSGLIDVLLTGEKLVSDCGDIAILIGRTNNPEAFAEHDEELDAVETNLGLQTEFTSERETRNILNADAEVDKKEIPRILSRLPNVDHKIPKVVEERMEGPVHALPSYLNIPRSEIRWDTPVRKYVRRSNQDPKKEVGWAFVHFGVWLGYKFAIKVFNCGAKENGDPDAWNQRQLLMEASSLVELQHPHVTRLVGYGQYEDLSVFVMELMDGDLRSFINSRLEQKKSSKDMEASNVKPSKDMNAFNDMEAFSVITQIAKGMYFIHSKGYTHGDLKCSNILVKNRGNQYLDVKIGDLRGSQKHGRWDPKAFEQASRTRRARWTAPEFIDYDGQEEPSWESLEKLDIYCFGMTCYEVVTGNYPFDGIRGDELLKPMIKRGEKPNDLPASLHEGLKILISSCWNTNPDERPPSFEKICQILDVIKPKTQGFSWIISWLLNQFVSGEEQKLVQHQGSEHATESSETFKREDLKIPECLIIDPKQLRKEGYIGEGASSTVYKIMWLHCTYAAKVFKYKIKSPMTRLVQVELNTLIKVSRHPCITQLIGLSVDPNGECSIIMEYIDGNLQELMDTRMKKRKVANRTRPFDDNEEFRIISEIALGMAYVHSRGLVHGDLKPTNVLAQARSGDVDVKIADFGFSYLEKSLELSDTHSEPMRMPYYTGFGTFIYLAPEMIKGEYHIEDLVKWGLPHPDQKPDFQALKKIDVYSFAVTCYQVLTGHPLNPHNLSVKVYNEKVIRENLRPTWPRHDLNSKLRPELKALVERCWVLNPQERPTFNQICEKLREINSN